MSGDFCGKGYLGTEQNGTVAYLTLISNNYIGMSQQKTPQGVIDIYRTGLQFFNGLYLNFVSYIPYAYVPPGYYATAEASAEPVVTADFSDFANGTTGELRVTLPTNPPFNGRTYTYPFKRA